MTDLRDLILSRIRQMRFPPEDVEYIERVLDTADRALLDFLLTASRVQIDDWLMGKPIID